METCFRVFRQRVAIITRLATIAAFIVAIGIPTTTHASYSTAKYFLDVTVSSESSIADGTSKITFTMNHTSVYCSGETAETARCGDKADAGSVATNYFITATGSDNKFGGTEAKENSVQYLSVKNTFTLASTTAETKAVVIKAQPYGPPSNPVTAEVTKTVSFIPPAKQQAAATTETPTTASEENPKVLKDTTFFVGGKKLNATNEIQLESTQTLTIKGTTVPNGLIKLLIFSTPREVNLAADAKGLWSYDVKGLETGQHHIEAEVTDPKTGTTSSRVALVSFAVATASAEESDGPAQTTSSANDKKASSKLPVIIVTILLLASVGTASWWYWRKRKKSDPSDDKSDKPAKIPELAHRLLKRPPKAQ